MLIIANFNLAVDFPTAILPIQAKINYLRISPHIFPYCEFCGLRTNLKMKLMLSIYYIHTDVKNKEI